MSPRLPLTVCLLLLGTQAHSGGHLALNCTGLDPAQDGDADTAFLCLEDYQQRLEALEGQIAKLIDANTGEPFSHGDDKHEETYLKTIPPSSVPTGAIMAFDLSDGCPDGWAPFAESQGRTIVGASFGMDDNLFRDDVLTQRKYRDHGGAEAVELKEAQMPSHRHGLPVVSGDVSSYMDAGLGNNVVYFDYSARDDVSWRIDMQRASEGVGPTGSSQPHENMPPFLALYFCKKT
ncbi:MAG: hypothetical protein QNJ20_00505 [Paracoccaceae bacterium]|nr:hypothetical protein [Paracoccaceae bacterium]